MQEQILRVLFGASLALLAYPAHAVEVDDFVRSIEASGGNLIYLGDARVAGDAVIVDGLSVRDGVRDILLDGQFTFAGITRQPNSGYLVDSITAPKIVFRDQATDFAFATLKGLSLEGYVVPGQSSPIPYPIYLHTGRFTWLDFPLTVGGFAFEIEPTIINDTVASVAISTAINGLNVDLPDDPPQSDKLASTLSALDVHELTFDFSESYLWHDDGRLSYSNQTRLAGFGEALLEFAVDGLTQARIEDIGLAWITAQIDNPTARTSWADPIFGLSIEQASFRYEAGPLLPQVLDHLGGEIGSRDALAAAIEDTIMAQVEALDIPAVTVMVRPTLRAFLAAPSSLEVRSDPPAPVTLMSVSAAMMLDKAGIVRLLGLSIDANNPPRADAP
ncbi:hypothetical protein [Devosia salina]|uniref:DUF4403 family protein n=1 Tax=Devosia salina TaxID=2860336 RepID=A0ABX8W9T9_9HYPH|nr:hypothetical protein [Devosia salina]QYO75477.1 hypothetical protein K1X15_12595 [Devosia salina]